MRRLTLVLLLAAAGADGREVWELQGAGLSSPFEGQEVTIADNTVTGVGDGVFFVQTPNARTDADPWTSDGILVRHSGAPVVRVGDRVTVTGTVEEHYDQTEIRRNVEVAVDSSGHPLPRAASLNAATPSPIQPWPENELERFEGMRVEVEDGFVTGPTDRYGDATATSSGTRLFREPGIEFPGLTGLPVWDGNPEVFEVDPDALGGGHLEFAAGSRFSADGVIAYAWGSYQLWPTSFDLVATAALPRAVAPSPSVWMTVASQNCERLSRTGGDVDFDDRLAKLSHQIRENLAAPSVVAVQEVDSLVELEAVATRVAADDPSLVYSAHLVEGHDPSGIDVGFLIRDDVAVEEIGQIGAEVRFSWDQTLLFDRPSLVLETVYAELNLTIVVVHLRSLGGIDEPGDEGERVRRKRFEQSEWLAQWIQRHQVERADDGLLVIGDFNAFEFSDGYVDVIGQITGLPDPAGALLPASVLVDPPLMNVVTGVPPDERYSYVFRGSAEVLDHALVDETLRPLIRAFSFARGNADAPDAAEVDPETALRSSDHDGLVVSIGPAVRDSGARRGL